MRRFVLLNNNIFYKVMVIKIVVIGIKKGK